MLPSQGRAADHHHHLPPPAAAAVHCCRSPRSWARNEGKGGAAQQEQGGLPELPYGVYLLVSCWFLIAGTGTVFEYAYKEPLFGVLPADSFLYAPASGVLFLGALLGAGKTWFTATRLANAENERDGYGQ